MGEVYEWGVRAFRAIDDGGIIVEEGVINEKFNENFFSFKFWVIE